MNRLSYSLGKSHSLSFFPSSIFITHIELGKRTLSDGSMGMRPMTSRWECKLRKCCRCAQAKCARALRFFVLKTVKEKTAFSRHHLQNTAETSQPQAKLTDDRRVIDMVKSQGLQLPWAKFGSGGAYSKKKANFADSRTLLFRGYTIKKLNTKDLERILQRSWLTRSTIDSTEQT